MLGDSLAQAICSRKGESKLLLHTAL